jgi:hypothetical protein
MGAAVLFLEGGFAHQASAQKLIAQEHAVASALNGDSGSGYRVGLGERATYDVEYKGHGVGTGTLEVLGRESVNGSSAFHAQMKLNAGWLFAKVNDRMDSWFDPRSYVSHRYAQDQREVMHSRKKNYEMAAEQGTYRETYSGDVDSLGSSEPLDDISMLFYVRTLPLKVGEVDTIPRYFKPGRDVIVKVLRKETITVPAGTFNTIVVQPTITNAGGLFGQGGKAEVYLTDDAQRTVVKLTSSVPVLGSLALTLREAHAGTP